MLSTIRALLSFNPKLLAIVAVAIFAAGNVSGGYIVHKFWSDTTARAEVAVLQRALQARDEAAKRNAELLKQHQEELEDLKRRAKDATDATPEGDCLDRAAVDRLRNLWNDTRPRSRSR